MEILPAKGLDNIRFGQTEDEIIRLLGKPDKTYLLDDSKRLQYFELRVEFSFEFEHENRLGWMEVHHPKAILFGQKLIGVSREKVLSVISSQIAESQKWMITEVLNLIFMKTTGWNFSLNLVCYAQ